ncbi:MAG: hypothetical protein AAE985_06970 [Thermoplasmataceae archaeon]|jgi:hypothetical protein
MWIAGTAVISTPYLVYIAVLPAPLQNSGQYFLMKSAFPFDINKPDGFTAFAYNPADYSVPGGKVTWRGAYFSHYNS